MATVLVPWRGGEPYRERAWRWVAKQWATTDHEVRLCPATEGRWCKAAAFMSRVADAQEIVVIADADCWTDGMTPALAAVAGGADWAVPHTKVHRLTEAATDYLLAGCREPVSLETEQRPYVGMVGGGIVVVRRDVLLEIPFDVRFTGWGREDCAWRDAMLTLVGDPWRGMDPLFHLWHPPQPDLGAERLVSRRRASEALYARYNAARFNPDQMAEIVAEAAAAEFTYEPEEPYSMFTYRNRYTGDEVTRDEISPRFERSEAWDRIDGDAPVAETADATTDPTDPAALSDSELVSLFVACASAIKEREETMDQAFKERLDDEITEIFGAEEDEKDETDDAPAQPEGTPAEPEPDDSTASSDESVKAPAEIEATPAAAELAEKEGIDLATVTGTGEDGKILIEDVRKAIESMAGTAG